MKLTFLWSSCLLTMVALGQSPADSVLNQWKKEVDSIKKTLPTIRDDHKSAVVLASGSEPVTKRDTTTWDGRWQLHIDKESTRIMQKMINRGVTKAIYKILIEFSINEDGSLKDLRVSSVPADAFIVQQCREMAMNAPKRKPVYSVQGKYVRAHIKQPVEIKINVAGQ
jgi:hypothetical protein